MDSLTYHGVTTTIIQTLGIEREEMYDESHTTWLYTRWRCNFVLAYNPGSMAFISGGGTSPPISNLNNNVMPPTTDVAIRAWFNQPRQQLVILSNGKTVINSPSNATLKCDARNGPFTKVNSVQRVEGERLWKIHLEIETYVNETPTPSLVLSNRWYASDDTNWQHLRTRTYRGICTVRADLLTQPGPTANIIDSLRASFAGFSIPIGFQRDKVAVDVTPDGLSARYTVTDVEQLWNKPSNCPAIRLEIADTNFSWQGSWGRALAGTISAMNHDIAQMWIPNPAAALASFARHGIAQTLAQLPKRYKNVLVRAWGNRITNRINLLNAALSLAQSRVGPAALIDTTTSEIVVTQTTDNFVQISQTVHWDYITAAQMGGPAGGIALAVQAFTTGVLGGPGDASWAASIAANPDMSPVLNPVSGAKYLQSQQLINPPFPQSNQTRGTAGIGSGGLQFLLSQTLENFNTAPAANP